MHQLTDKEFLALVDAAENMTAKTQSDENKSDRKKEAENTADDTK